MLPAYPRRPSQIIGALLTGHPEAANLLTEAVHCQALARSSAANVGQEFAAAQTIRLHYEELRYKHAARSHLMVIYRCSPNSAKEQRLTGSLRLPAR